MPYYIRVFCASPSVPPLRKVLDWVAAHGWNLRLDPEIGEPDLDSPDWSQVGLIYRDDRMSWLCDLDRDDGSAHCLVREETKEFEEDLQGLPDSPKRQRVIEHLRKTKFIVANQIPTTDMNDSDLEVVSIFCEYFVEYYGGIVHADGEGFYQGRELAVELP